MIQAAESETHNSGSYWPTGFHFSYCLFFRLKKKGTGPEKVELTSGIILSDEKRYSRYTCKFMNSST